MSEKTHFQSICADFSDSQIHLFDIEKEYDDYDCHDTCVIWSHITFYGVPLNASDDDIQSLYEHDYKNALKIGELTGCLIMCKQMLFESEDPLIICDDLDADLEYTVSALSDEECPLDENPYQDVYYIHDLAMEDGYKDDVLLKSRIIDELPVLILKFLHVAPDILAFYPLPLEHEPDPDEEVRYNALQNIKAQKISSALASLSDEQPEEKSNVINFGDAYKFSEDELNMVMRRRYSGSSYPEAAKDKDEYAFYATNGFIEANDSRLLYKYVGLE